MKKIFLIFIFPFFSLFLSSCSSDDDLQHNFIDYDLVGAWFSNSYPFVQRIFNNDGSGVIIQENYANIIEWHINSYGQLVEIITLDDYYTKNIWYYELENDSFKIIDIDDSSILISHYLIENNPLLVGQWLRGMDNGIVLSLNINYDKTGINYFSNMSMNFEWFTAGDLFVINYEYDIQEIFNFEIENNILYLHRLYDDITYTNYIVYFDYDLLGIWHWDNYSNFIFNFKEEGEGYSTWMEEFSWITAGQYLILNLGEINEEIWIYNIIENEILELESAQVPGLQFSYTRNPSDNNYISDIQFDFDISESISEIYDQLIGIWHWDLNDQWQYNFLSDGRGTRGIQYYQNFYWTTYPNLGILIINYNDIEEIWFFDINNYQLILMNADNLEEIYIYNR